MLTQHFLEKKTFFLIPVVFALVLAAACGGSAQPTAVPVTQPTVAAKPVVKATEAPAPVATKAPAVVEPVASGGPGLATFDLKAPIINTDRSRAPEGTLNLAYHTALSPKWLDPQEAPASRTPYSAFIGNVFDPMIGATEQGTHTLMLAEHFEMTDDFKKATFRLRDGLKFHDGSTVTTADVKFTYENYSGALADIFHDNTASIEVVDDKTIVFNFNKPFIDFLLLYGSQAAGIGYIVPAEYYQKVGPDGFKEAPIGTGPYKVVGQTTGQEVVMDAFDDYWRQRPNIKTFVTRGVPELASRVAGLMTGEIDVAYFVTGALLQDAIDNPNIQIDPNNSAPFWLFFPGWEEADSPFHDERVREAISIALDRDFLAQSETAGLAIVTGNFIPPGKPGRIEREPDTYDLAKAKQLMADAGFPDGFEIDAFTPFPPVFSLGERIMDQLRDIGIKSTFNTTQRPVFLSQLREHRAGFPGNQIVFSISTGPPDAAAYIRAFAICEGNSSVTCDPNIDEKFAQHEASLDLAERARLVEEIQQYILEEHIFVPVYINAFAMGAGPKLAGEIEDYTKVFVSLYPYDDVKLNP